MAGLDVLPDAISIALLVRDVTGREPRNPRPLGSGVTTIAWRVETDGAPLVVLVQKPEAARVEATGGIGDIPPRFGGQLAILDALHSSHPLDARVPQPIAWSGDTEHDGAARFALRWAIVSEAAGAPGAATDLTPDGASDVGEWLARLHELSCEGFGLTEDRRDRLVGGASDMASGLLERWPGLWPFDGTSLLAHPVVRLAPRILEPASRFREAILRFGLLTRAVVLHSDLNPLHLYLRAGRVATVIDLSDAFVGPPAADFAVFASHYGWERTQQAIEAHASSQVLREMRLAETELLAVAVGLYRIRKRVTLQQPRERVERDVAFLETTIERAAHLLRG